MTRATLLVELLTEELPPKSLLRLAEAFRDALLAALRQDGFAGDASKARALATPRRLAVEITQVLGTAADQSAEVTGPSVKAPQQAVEGFARKNGVQVANLAQVDTPKGKVYACRRLTQGSSLDAGLASKVEHALKHLPIPKMMRWGDGDAQFVRPVHGLVMMHGMRVVPGTVLGLSSGKLTRGHRFMGAGEIKLASADEYEKRLRDEGKVIADFAVRRAEIERQLLHTAREHGAQLGEYAGLLDEVAALVEHPTVYTGAFDATFLSVPQECLILTMRQNQKYFPLFDAGGRLQAKFLIVSNMLVADPRHIIAGNQRVVRPRLEDARFFFDQDRRQRLQERTPRLAKVVYHNKLGSQLERVQRIKLLAGKIARVLGADPMLAERAAELAKADLLTGMVGEFPELQGIMGRYYALHDKEPGAVADAIEAHYRPRFAGDHLPEGPVACAVALADKLDAIAGMFSIDQQPTGDKDPFGLRRAALGVVRILVEHRLHLSLFELASAALEPFQGRAPNELMDFIYDRFTGYLKDLGYTTLQVDAVLSKRPVNLGVVPLQLEAVKAFEALPEAESLAAANKRVANILRQAEAKGESFGNAALGELTDPAERALHGAIRAAAEKATPLYENGDYTGYLKSFAVLKGPVDTFFDKVMVMVEDDKLRRGRLALLRDLREAMNRVADISRLAK
ncbi:MAG: glycine--tRNA ligase subunit beta [Betaproteobacteria bacterium]|nr:glycine--tRNA ligase subunit beta [Betaproteobacteria bacterium]